MKHLLIIASFLLVFSTQAFSQGIEFKHISYDDALELAKKENKLLFLDFYTDWCGPCKKLVAQSFPDAEVGAHYNKKYISIKLDAEKEGREVAQKYKVASFPTLIYLNANEQVLLRKSGYKSPEALIEMAKSAEKSLGEEYSLEDFKRLYPAEKDDEDFLLLYMDKLTSLSLSPIEIVEQWLTVQEGIEENSRDMYEFLARYRRILYFGAKAGEIFDANKEAYQALFPEGNLSVNLLELDLIRNTKGAAKAQQSPELMRIYIDKCKAIEPHTKHPLINDYNEVELEYLLIANNVEGYKYAAKSYIDSIQSVRTFKQIKADDDKLFQMLYKNTDYNSLSEAERRKYNSFKEGRSSLKAINPILDEARTYLKYCDTKADYKQLNQWVDYCYKLQPNSVDVDLLKADLLFKQGKKQEAIALKEKALSKVSSTKQRAKIEVQIQEMRE
ncbi:MAG: thioredoxin family protein [Mangrovibacterium sp.]